MIQYHFPRFRTPTIPTISFHPFPLTCIAIGDFPFIDCQLSIEHPTGQCLQRKSCDSKRCCRPTSFCFARGKKRCEFGGFGPPEISISAAHFARPLFGNLTSAPFGLAEGQPNIKGVPPCAGRMHKEGKCLGILHCIVKRARGWLQKWLSPDCISCSVAEIHCSMCFWKRRKFRSFKVSLFGLACDKC